MEQVIEALLRRLTRKGLSPDEVPWLIRDVLNVVAEAGELAVNAINRRLATLGWDEEILDKVSFELIMYLVEEHDEDRPRFTHAAPSGP